MDEFSPYLPTTTAHVVLNADQQVPVSNLGVPLVTHTPEDCLKLRNSIEVKGTPGFEPRACNELCWLALKVATQSGFCNAHGQRWCDVFNCSLLSREILLLGAWCSGITSASHAEGPGLNPQCVHCAQSIEEQDCCSPMTTSYGKTAYRILGTSVSP